ncbi:nitroreductase [Rhodococcus sp. SC4]|nr:nitroreductase [Rhodococcus sp. SC4]
MPLEGTYEPSTRDISREQVELYERSNGAEGNTRHGLPVVIVTSIGARSRALRKTPLMRVEHQGRYALVASLGGGPRHPVWYHNLRAHPHVELQDGPAKVDYLAREVTGSERDDWWNRAVAAFPMYADYQEQTDRIIPVFVLEPMCGVQGTESSAPGLDEDRLP